MQKDDGGPLSVRFYPEPTRNASADLQSVADSSGPSFTGKLVGMNISENVLTAGAVFVELGLPIVLFGLNKISHQAKTKAVVILGALTPLLVVYAVISVAYLIFPRDKGDLFAFFAIWVVSFAFYAASALIGVAVSFLKWPAGMCARFALGLASTPVAYGAIFLLSMLFR
jgi:hypothetical protein